MINPQQIKQKALKHWQTGHLLGAYLCGEDPFPLDIPFRKPTAKQALEGYAELRLWVNELRLASKSERGFGYTLEFASVNHRQLGRQQLPQRIGFKSFDDLLPFIGKQQDFARFCALVAETQEAQPQLQNWLKQNPLKLIKHQVVWSQLLHVCRYFCENPHPERYLRELEIEGVDSKFIEGHKRILRELLDQLLPAASIDAEMTTLSGTGFERRFGLRYDEPLIRLRILDPTLAAPWKLSDLSLPLSQFQTLDLQCQRIFITENKVNGLSFPQVSGAVVIFGLGYGIQALKEVSWLKKRDIFYWGDIDTHGFAILSQLRGYFPRTQSMLMDRQTLCNFEGLWVAEEAGKRCLADLPHLTPEEQTLYQNLCCNRLGENVRLEQERIAFSRLQDWLDGLAPLIASGPC